MGKFYSSKKKKLLEWDQAKSALTISEIKR